MKQVELHYGKDLAKMFLTMIFFFMTAKLSYAGLSDEFITGARLDNL
jgi:hypothetical protein